MAGRLTVEFNKVSEPSFQLIAECGERPRVGLEDTFCHHRIFHVLINTTQRFFRLGYLAQQVPAISSSLELLFTPQEPDSSTVTVSSLSPQLQAAVSARLSSRTTKTSHSLPSGSRTQVLS